MLVASFERAQIDGPNQKDVPMPLCETSAA
jgi:hypothetical protein